MLFAGIEGSRCCLWGYLPKEASGSALAMDRVFLLLTEIRSNGSYPCCGWGYGFLKASESKARPGSPRDEQVVLDAQGLLQLLVVLYLPRWVMEGLKWKAYRKIMGVCGNYPRVESGTYQLCRLETQVYSFRMDTFFWTTAIALMHRGLSDDKNKRRHREGLVRDLYSGW